ncbi:MAG TPA: secondary thiamine-phosphate synthase enzyme YjbQ [Candidatus Binataceae bacterium]|nr:secondary thiamine-phosphate synthase enzyme YjbQ [Candidatus Binataceae bacterium]
MSQMIRVTSLPAPASVQSVIVSDILFTIPTKEPIEFVDLTDRINEYLRRADIHEGAVTVFSRHTTAAIKINEAEELLLEDFKHFLRRLCPVEHAYNHNDMSRRKPPIALDERPNGHSHLMHLLLATSETIPVSDYRLALGTWQRVFMIELDGPRTREVMVRCHAYTAQEASAATRSNRDVNGDNHRRLDAQ